MPRLSRKQRHQAVGRLGAGESGQIVANAYNVNVRTIYRLKHRYNTTNSINDRPRSGRPRFNKPRQGRFILRQHLQDRFTTIDTARHTIGTLQRPISADTVRRRLAPNSINCRLQWTTASQYWRYQQCRKILVSVERRFCVLRENTGLTKKR